MPDPIPSVQDCLGAAGEPPRVTHAGQEWVIGFPTQRTKARLEELIAAAAVTEVVALKGTLPADVYAEMWADVKEAVRSREHRVGGRLWAGAMGSPHGGVFYLLALLREHRPDATEAEAVRLAAAEPEQVSAALDRVTPLFLRAVATGAGATAAQTDALLARHLTPGRRPGTPPSTAD